MQLFLACLRYKGSTFGCWVCPPLNPLARSGGGGARRGGAFSLSLGTRGIAPFLESFLLYAFTVERCHWGSNPTVHQAPGGFFHQSMLDRHKNWLYISRNLLHFQINFLGTSTRRCSKFLIYFRYMYHFIINLLCHIVIILSI